jgi:hypothetical protein
VYRGFDEFFTTRVEGTVVGLVENTYFESVALPVRPMVFLLAPPEDMGFSLTHASIRVAPGVPLGWIISASRSRTPRRSGPSRAPSRP